MEELPAHLLTLANRVEAIQRALTQIPALGPENGGQGELSKCLLVEELLANAGMVDQVRFDSPDPRVECGFRPNLVARKKGRLPTTLWIFAHLDVVPPGEGWDGDPWELRREGDMIIGRGVEDNQQAIASMIILAEALHKYSIMPDLGLGFVFMADEENGSRHGLGHILDVAPDLFAPRDLLVVPDGGSPDASAIEIAEKAQLWLKFIVRGKQCHASLPGLGKNALVAASELVVALQELERDFPELNPLFDPPRSTFVPTRHTSPDTAINILPGDDAFHLDCRIIPGIPLEEVHGKIDEKVARIVAKTGCAIDTVAIQENPASVTPEACLVVEKLAGAIESVYGVKARVCGIGGGTVAALLRQRDLHAAVWACLQNTCHQPNERSSLLDTCRDAAVFAWLLQNA